MNDATYHIVAIAVAAIAIIKGFRIGFTGQVSGVLGFAFGTVCAHVFDEQAEAFMRMILPGLEGRPGCSFVYSVCAAALVYLTVFMIFRIFTKVLRSAMQVFYVGMLDKLLGAAFCLVKYMLVLSIIYNLILCVNPSSPLMKYATAEDGNIVEVVMMLAPGLLGCHSYEDLSHIMQLREAKKISCNINSLQDVINNKGIAVSEYSSGLCLIENNRNNYLHKNFRLPEAEIFKEHA